MLVVLGIAAFLASAMLCTRSSWAMWRMAVVSGIKMAACLRLMGASSYQNSSNCQSRARFDLAATARQRTGRAMCLRRSSPRA